MNPRFGRGSVEFGSRILSWLAVGEFPRWVEGLVDASIYEVLLTLRHFKRIVCLNSSKEITPRNLDTFVLKRSEDVGKNTLNKDIRNLHAFLNWAVKNRFVASGLEVKKVKVPQKPVFSLSPKQVRDLITLASRYPTLRLRILLAVTTGLRRGDLEAIQIGDIHFDRNTIMTHNRKAKKAMAERPVPEQITTELSNHVRRFSVGILFRLDEHGVQRCIAEPPHHVKDKHLPGFILSKAGYKDRIVGAVPTRGAVDADIAAVCAFINPLTANKGTVTAPIYGVIVFICLFVPVAVDKPLAAGRKRNIALWLGKHFGCTHLSNDLLLFQVIVNLLIPFSADEDIVLVPFRMPANKLLVQGQPCAVGMDRTWGVDLVAFISDTFLIPSGSYEEVNTIAISIPKRVVDEQSFVI